DRSYALYGQKILTVRLLTWIFGPSRGVILVSWLHGRRPPGTFARWNRRGFPWCGKSHPRDAAWRAACTRGRRTATEEPVLPFTKRQQRRDIDTLSSGDFEVVHASTANQILR